MTLDELLAREGIRKTIAAYTDAGDNGRYDDLVLCYAEDGVFEIATGLWQGRRQIHQALQSLRSDRSRDGVRLQRHHLGTCRMDIDGPDAARSITYFSVISDTGLDHARRYVDRHVRCGDAWLFAHRNVVVEWAASDSRFLPPAPSSPLPPSGTD